MYDYRASKYESLPAQFIRLVSLCKERCIYENKILYNITTFYFRTESRNIYILNAATFRINPFYNAVLHLHQHYIVLLEIQRNIIFSAFINNSSKYITVYYVPLCLIVYPVRMPEQVVKYPINTTS